MSERRLESGQAVMLYAVLIPLSVFFGLGILDYMVTNLRVMETVAAADLAAHAGAQSVRLLPDGTILSRPSAANQVAASYFYMQAPDGASLTAVSCGLREGRPSCRVHAQVLSTGYFLPRRWVRVDALGILAYGATRADQ